MRLKKPTKPLGLDETSIRGAFSVQLLFGSGIRAATPPQGIFGPKLTRRSKVERINLEIGSKVADVDTHLKITAHTYIYLGVLTFIINLGSGGVSLRRATTLANYRPTTFRIWSLRGVNKEGVAVSYVEFEYHSQKGLTPIELGPFLNPLLQNSNSDSEDINGTRAIKLLALRCFKTMNGEFFGDMSLEVPVHTPKDDKAIRSGYGAIGFHIVDDLGNIHYTHDEDVFASGVFSLKLWCLMWTFATF
eukprot:Platyproteum_vivax@DN14094_c0_g1_i1.p1